MNASVQPRVEPRFGAGRELFEIFEASAAAATHTADASAHSRAAAYATMINGVDDNANGMWQG